MILKMAAPSNRAAVFNCSQHHSHPESRNLQPATYNPHPTTF